MELNALNLYMEPIQATIISDPLKSLMIEWEVIRRLINENKLTYSLKKVNIAHKILQFSNETFQAVVIVNFWPNKSATKPWFFSCQTGQTPNNEVGKKICDFFVKCLINNCQITSPPEFHEFLTFDRL